MKLKLIFQLFIFLSLSCLNAQNNDKLLDSLNLLLQNKKLPDTSIFRIKIDIGTIGYIDRLGYWDSLKHDIDLKLKKSTNKDIILKLSFYNASAINCIGYLYEQKGLMAKSLELYTQSFNVLNKVKLNSDSLLTIKILIDKAQIIDNIATVSHKLGLINKGKVYHNKSLQIRLQINNKEGIAQSYNNLGAVEAQEGNIKLALDYYFKCLKIREEIEDWKGIAQVYGNIATLYSQLYGLEKALVLHRKSLYYYTKINSKSGISHVLNNIGTCFSDLRQLDSASFYYQKALNLRLELGNKKTIGYSYLGIGRLNVLQKNTKKGRKF